MCAVASSSEISTMSSRQRTLSFKAIAPKQETVVNDETITDVNPMSSEEASGVHASKMKEEPSPSINTPESVGGTCNMCGVPFNQLCVADAPNSGCTRMIRTLQTTYL